MLCSLFLLGCGKDDPERILAKDREKILKYIADNNLNAQEHSTGIFYVIETQGSGSFPRANSVVVINYTGYLLNGKVFDSNHEIALSLSHTILGWQYGIPLFQRGSKGKLLIPSGLGYGEFPRPGIPANSVLIFDIELIDF